MPICFATLETNLANRVGLKIVNDVIVITSTLAFNRPFKIYQFSKIKRYLHTGSRFKHHAKNNLKSSFLHSAHYNLVSITPFQVHPVDTH